MLLCVLQAEAQEYIATCTCPDYLRKAEKRLAEESERVTQYLDASTEPKITKVVETELVQKQVCAYLLKRAWGMSAACLEPGSELGVAAHSTKVVMTKIMCWP